MHNLNCVSGDISLISVCVCNCKHVHLQQLSSRGSQAKQIARADPHRKPVLWHNAAGGVGGSK